MAADLEAIERQEVVKKILEQQRIAHKLLAAFYQQVVQTFDDIAENCACNFSAWGPIRTDFPNQEDKIADNWIWNYLPLYASVHEYTKVQHENHARRGDSILVLKFLCDSAFADAEGYVDPLDLESKESYIDICIYKCTQNRRISFYKVYEDSGWPEKEGKWQDDPEENQGVRIYYKRILLEEFLLHKKHIATQIKNLIDKGEDYVPDFCYENVKNLR